MGVPLIKLYRLPANYVQASDSDIQSNWGDELIPVVTKLTQLSDVAALGALTGVVLSNNQPLYCFNFNGGTPTNDTLAASAADPSYFLPVANAWATSVLWQSSGALGIQVLDQTGTPIAPANLLINNSGIKSLVGTSTPTTCDYFLRAAIGTQNTFALLGDQVYLGSNPNWNRLLLTKNGGSQYVGTPPANGVGYITVTGVTTSLIGHYACTVNPAKTFLSNNGNWVNNHLRLSPDVFVGTETYPGDQVVDANGNVISAPGPMPAWVAPGTYQINYRDGYVTFASPIDNMVNPVVVNMSYAVGVVNVTGQVLTPTNGSNLTFSASAETVYPASHGARWANRNSSAIPTNVYINGVATPVATTVSPAETLTLKLHA